MFFDFCNRALVFTLLAYLQFYWSQIRGAAIQACHRIKIALSAHREEPAQSCDTVSPDGNRLLCRDIYSGQQNAEDSPAGIADHTDGDTDKRADLGLGATNLVASEAECLLLVLVAEMAFAVRRVGDVEMFAAEYVQVRRRRR